MENVLVNAGAMSHIQTLWRVRMLQFGYKLLKTFMRCKSVHKLKVTYPMTCLMWCSVMWWQCCSIYQHYVGNSCFCQLQMKVENDTKKKVQENVKNVKKNILFCWIIFQRTPWAHWCICACWHIQQKWGSEHVCSWAVFNGRIWFIVPRQNSCIIVVRNYV